MLSWNGGQPPYFLSALPGESCWCSTLVCPRVDMILGGQASAAAVGLNLLLLFFEFTFLHVSSLKVGIPLLIRV